MTLKEYAEQLSFLLLGWEVQKAHTSSNPTGEGEAIKQAFANQNERLAQIKKLSECDFLDSF